MLKPAKPPLLPPTRHPAHQLPRRSLTLSAHRLRILTTIKKERIHGLPRAPDTTPGLAADRTSPNVSSHGAGPPFRRNCYGEVRRVANPGFHASLHRGGSRRGRRLRGFARRRLHHQHPQRPRAPHSQRRRPQVHDGGALRQIGGLLQGQRRFDAHRVPEPRHPGGERYRGRRLSDRLRFRTVFPFSVQRESDTLFLRRRGIERRQLP